MKTWKELEKQNRVKSHRTSPEELADLFSVVDRDLRDASITALSDDRRFATAYNAVLQLCKVVIAVEGYRVSGSGHHQTSIEAQESLSVRLQEACLTISIPVGESATH